MADQNNGAPPRPYLPPTLFLAAATCASCGCVMQAGWNRHEAGDVVPWALMWLLAIAGTILLLVGVRSLRGFDGRVKRAPRRRVYVAASVALAGIGCALGSVLAAGELCSWEEKAGLSRKTPVSACIVRVLGDPSLGERGASSTVEVVLPGDSGSYRARMTTDEPFEDGVELKVVGGIDSLGDDDWARSRFMKGEVCAIRVRSVLSVREGARRSAVRSVRRAALAAIGPERSEARSLVAGTVCGRVTELGASEAYEAFSRCGLTHLVAVSGSHLAYIAALLETLLRRMRLGRVAREASLLLVMVLYVLFTGGAPSALRSVSMVGLASAAVLGGRRAHAPSALFITVTVLSLVNPGVVFDLGFRLSAVSVLFITVFARYASHLMERLHLPAVLGDHLALALVAQWATLPLTIPVFGEVSLIAPFANIVVAPVMTALLVTGLICVAPATLEHIVASVFFGTGSAFSPFGDLLLWIPAALAQGSMFLAQLCARAPFASIAVSQAWWIAPLMYGLAGLLYVRWVSISARRALLVLAAACFLFGVQVMRWGPLAPPSVTVLDVGQGDAILVRDGSSRVLVDAGVDGAALRALARNHVHALDAVVVTHWDRDHWGGLVDILPIVPVGSIIVAEGASAAAPDEVRQAGVPIVELSKGDAVRVGSFACRAVWPGHPVVGEENADSLVLDVEYRCEGRRLNILLTGDTERDELGRYACEVGDVDVLKLGHHGSRVSVDSDSLELLDPELAVASAGEGNRYGHPDPACIELAVGSGARFLCTKDAGDIVIEPGARGPRVRTARD